MDLYDAAVWAVHTHDKPGGLDPSAAMDDLRDAVEAERACRAAEAEALADGRSVRVRVPVLVWYDVAADPPGWWGEPDYGENPNTIITAVVPVPQPVEVRGEVEDEGGRP